jgi:intraflagellar transport protein 172
MIAYLLDQQTICIQDLDTNIQVASISHDTKIDFLELNPSGTKLLYRDKKRL